MREFDVLNVLNFTANIFFFVQTNFNQLNFTSIKMGVKLGHVATT